MTKLLANFGLTEALLTTTILALVALLLVVSVGESGKKERDAGRKTDVKAFFGAVEQFKADYGTFPDFNTRLGAEPSLLVEAPSYDLAATLATCEAGSFRPDSFAVAADLVTPVADYNQAYLKPGFNAVSNFLNCLGYRHQTASDPIAAGTVYNYHYRVSHDAASALAAATLERLNDGELSTIFNDRLLAQYYVSDGPSRPALDDDSDTDSFFAALTGRSTANGRYLYQCLFSADKKALSASERISQEYQPILDSGAINPKCLDSLEGLLTVEAN
ncbi:MAG: hypothetical protein WEC83_00440 [Patescibacteria group bacterium]